MGGGGRLMGKKFPPLPVQREAADPSLSVFVTANAGSGKTTVLVDRILRLLIEGATPASIQCLTFTRAAAVEMTERLRDRLRQMAIMGSDDLAEEIQRLCGRPAKDDETIRARGLFVTILEQPGPRLETIHAFAERLLSLFPEEAGLPAGARLADDNDLAALEPLVEDALFAHLGQMEDGLQHFSMLEARHGANNLLAMIARMTPDRAMQMVLPPLGADDEGRFSEDMRLLLREMRGQNSATISKWLPSLESYLEGRLEFVGLASFFLTASGSLRKSLLKDLNHLFHPLQESFVNILDGRELQRITSEHEALRKLGLLRFHLRSQIKHDHGLMEFDDLIQSAKGLLGMSEARDYVAFMLDARIEHLLVDEAQDTGPDSWGIINILLGNMLEEMEGRSSFVVGDVKQSIYGFQGAMPSLMLQVRDDFMEQMKARNLKAKSLPMPISFRSAGAILSFVDRLFCHLDDMARVAGPGGEVGHEAFQDAYGRVDLWPLPELPEDAELDPWEDPVNRYGRASPSVILAESMADWLQAQLATDRPECGGGRLRPKDVFLLFRKRGALFQEMSRALRQRGVPCSGGDRLILADQLLTLDVIALLRWMVTPHDDMRLAVIMRSSLLGFDEAMLEQIVLGASDEGSSLWGYLQRRHGDLAKPLVHLLAEAHVFGDGHGVVNMLRAREHEAVVANRYGRPELLTLELIIDRLTEAQAMGLSDGLSLSQALAQDKTDIKRELGADEDVVRLTTIHGAKGLEARLVVVMDATAKPQSRTSLGLMEAAEGRLIYAHQPTSLPLPSALASQREARAEESLAEDLRLFYVACTRASSQLILAGPGRKRPNLPEVTFDEDSWYGRAQAALDGLGALKGDDGRVTFAKGLANLEAEPTANKSVEMPDISLPEFGHGPWLVDVAENAQAQRGTRLHQIVQKAMTDMATPDEFEPALAWFFNEAGERGWLKLSWQAEVALGDGQGNLRFIDLLHRSKDSEALLLEIKTGSPREEHVSQLKDYLELVGPSAKGYLCYLDQQEVVALGP